MTNKPSSIVLSIRDKDNVYLLSMVVEHTSPENIIKAFKLSFPLLTLGAITTIELNLLDLSIGDVKIQQGVMKDANEERSKYYTETGN